MSERVFKMLASKGGRIVFDQRVVAATPREARERMKQALGLEKLAGVVYAITEIPVEVIREIVSTQMAGVVMPRGNRVNLRALVASAVQGATASALAEVERRLAQVERVSREGNRPQTRRDPLGDIGTGAASEDGPTRAIPAQRRAIAGPDWRAIRRRYQQTRSVKRTAAEFDVSPNTLKARIRRGGWGR
jgi:P2-related tail formation protein